MTSTMILSLGALAVASAFAFVQVELRAKEPILPSSLLKYNTDTARHVGGGSWFTLFRQIGGSIGVALFGTMFSTSLRRRCLKHHW